MKKTSRKSKTTVSRKSRQSVAIPINYLKTLLKDLDAAVKAAVKAARQAIPKADRERVADWLRDFPGDVLMGNYGETGKEILARAEAAFVHAFPDIDWLTVLPLILLYLPILLAFLKF